MCSAYIFETSCACFQAAIASLAMHPLTLIGFLRSSNPFTRTPTSSLAGLFTFDASKQISNCNLQKHGTSTHKPVFASLSASLPKQDYPNRHQLLQAFAQQSANETNVSDPKFCVTPRHCSASTVPISAAKAAAVWSQPFDLIYANTAAVPCESE